MYPTIDLPWLGMSLPTQQLILWTASAAAILLGPYWIQRLEGLEAWRVRRAQLTLAIIPIAFARLHFILNNPHFFANHPLNALKPWGGAMHMGGALIGIIVGVPLVARYYGLSIAKLGDGLVPIVGVCVVAARIGCLLAGCCYGTPCSYPFCLTYPEGSFAFVMHRQAGLLPEEAHESLAVHPSQLYFLLVALLATLAALWVGRRKRYDGEVVWVGTILLFGGTALLEVFRAPELQRVFWAGVPQLTWTESAMALVGVIGLAVSEVRHRRWRSPDVPGAAPAGLGEAAAGPQGSRG
jgi:phosphatidylglycerol:prolipoprotein diacylglycerol transferase